MQRNVKVVLAVKRMSKHYDYVLDLGCLWWENAITDTYKPSVEYAHGNKYKCIHYIELSLLRFRFAKALTTDDQMLICQFSKNH